MDHEFLSVEVLGDGLNLQEMLESHTRYSLCGFTTNPTLLRKLGVREYEKACREMIQAAAKLPISIEVLSDDEAEMYRQARLIASWGENVYVKIPVIHASGALCTGLIRTLAKDGIRVNVTAVLTASHGFRAVEALKDCPKKNIISVFAGRIADCGGRPESTCWEIASRAKEVGALTLWASTRNVGSIFLAERANCELITMTAPLLEKLHVVKKHPEDYALETVREFLTDAKEAGFQL